MIIRVGLILFVISVIRTTDGFDSAVAGRSYWSNKPIYNEKLVHLRKRDSDTIVPDTHADVSSDQNASGSNVTKKTDIHTEAGVVSNIDLQQNKIPVNSQQAPQSNPEQMSNKTLPLSNDNKNGGTTNTTLEPPKVSTTAKPNEVITSKTAVNEKVASNSTEAENLLKDPGVVKRGLIVFGGFALLAVAYFVFYRRKGKKYDANNLHNNNDNNQFRYGVLQSEDRRDNLELSRIPLTMESDEDDEEDLEIFDLEQKRKSLSYVNLQTNDEDIVLHSSKDESKNNLLLDIEDGPSDTLINWSNNGNKSIL